MSITINSIGPNSRQIVVSNENGPSNIIDAVDTSLTALGWTLYDTVSSGSKNMFVTKVYSAPNNDSDVSPTTKYMILRFDVSKQRWWASCCEAWNTTTHVATNECWIANRNFPLSFQNSNLIIYIWATSRYAVFQTAVRGELGIWQGVFEWERGDMPEDNATDGAPCFGWTNARLFALPYDQAQTSSNQAKKFSMMCAPRTLNGYTGIGAARQFTASTGFGDFPPNHMHIVNGSTLSVPNADITGAGLAQIYYSGPSYANNSTSKVIINPKLGPAGNSYISTGRIYGMTIIPGFAEQLDTVTIPVDANGFYSNTGSNTTHYIMGLTGGNLSNLNVGNLKLTQKNFTACTTTYTMTSSIIVDGKKIFCGTTTANTCAIYDLESETWSTVTTTHGTSNSGLAYDGESKVYIAGSLGIAKIDTSNNATWTKNATPTSGGYTALTIDDTNLYASWYTASTTPKYEKIALSDLTVSNTITSITIASGTWNGLSMGDFDGHLYMFSSISSGATSRFAKVNTSNNTVIFNNAVNRGAYGPTGEFVWYDGVAWHMVPVGGGTSVGAPYRIRLYNDGSAGSFNNYADNFTNAYGGTGLTAGKIIQEPICYFGGRIGQPNYTGALTSAIYPIWVQPPVNGTALTEVGVNGNSSTYPDNYSTNYVVGNSTATNRSRLGQFITDGSTLYNIGTTEAYNPANATASGSARFTGQMSVRHMGTVASNMPHVIIKA